MKPFSFDVRVGDTPEARAALIDRLQELVESKKGTFSQRLQTFSGTGFAGSYNVNGGTATITITKKPALVFESYIEKKIRAFIEG